MHEIVAMILAGGRVEELSVLTLIRPKAAVPFAGQFRIVDFALSSLVRSEVERVGVISLYRPASLIEHLGVGEPWDLVGRGRGVKILPPFQGETGSQLYRGTADAVYQNLAYVKAHRPRDVLVLSGDHIYGMDFRPVFRQHRESNADLTMVVKTVPEELGRGRFGFAEVDGNRRVTGYEEKPAEPRSNLASLTIYLFKTDVLIERLENNQHKGTTWQLYGEVIPEMVERDRVFAFPYEGYWNYTRSVDSFHQAHMDLLQQETEVDLAGWGIRSRPQLRGLGDLPPTLLKEGCGCVDSMVSPGAVIAGEVTRSVIGPGVRVEAGARVTSSVLMTDTVIRRGAVVDRAVLDKRVLVGEGAKVGFGEPSVPNRNTPDALREGVSVVGKSAVIPEGASVGRNCVVYPEVRPEMWASLLLENGNSQPATGGSAP
jgi:glucose-1-phosphate adenylyltransferase